MLGLGLYLTSSQNVGHPAAVVYDSAATAYFAAMSVQPDATRKGLLNALIVGLKADGVWSLLDWLSIMAAHNAQAARINAKTPAQVATASGSPTFTTDRGYTGNIAGSAYLETSVADNAAGNWTQNAASMFAWANQAPSIGGAAIGLSSGTSTKLQLAPSVSALSRLHSATNGTSTTPNGLGFSEAVRTDNVTLLMYRAGLLEGTTTTVATSATTADTFRFFQSNGALFYDGRLAVGGWGGILDATKSLALYNRLNTYLTAVGGT